MEKETKKDLQNPLHAATADAPMQEEPSARKKTFVKPTLTRHGALPDVTTGFFGSFSP